MLKTILTLAALATLATGTIVPAHALISVNGGGENGFIRNGEMPNGGGANGGEDGSSTLTIQALELPPQPQ